MSEGVKEVRILVRQDTAERWEEWNPVLGQGEIGLNLTNKRVKMGDGERAWEELAYEDALISEGLSVLVQEVAGLGERVGGVEEEVALKAERAAVEAGLALKVDKVSGKGLSTEDFTAADKAALAGLQEEVALKVDKVSGKGLSTEDYTAADKAALAGLQEEVALKVDKAAGKGLSTHDFTGSYKGQLDGLSGELAQKVTREAGKGLSTHDFTGGYKGRLDGLSGELAQKVTREAGKGLSTEDYTAADKQVVSGVAGELAKKQDVLAFDEEPNPTSGNVVRSRGIALAVAGRQERAEELDYAASAFADKTGDIQVPSGGRLYELNRTTGEAADLIGARRDGAERSIEVGEWRNDGEHYPHKLVLKSGGAGVYAEAAVSGARVLTGADGAALAGSIDAEAAARAAADGELASGLAGEAAARADADEALQEDIADEANARETADADEESARETADAALAGSIDDEAEERETADAALAAGIDAEAAARESADIAEAETRFNDDMLLQEHIDAEATARSQADTALNERLSAVESEKENIANKVNVSSGATEAHYPNAKSVYEYGQSIIESLSGGLKTPLSYSLESDVPTTIADMAIGTYFVVEDMNITKPGHSGRIWVNELAYFENECTLADGGAGYIAGDILHGGRGGIHIVIESVDANGAIQTWRYEASADYSYRYTYTDASGAAVPFTGGTGTGAAFDVVSTEQPKAKFFFRVIDQYMHPDGISIVFTPAGALEIATDWLKQWAETQNIFLNNIPVSGEVETGKRFNGKPLYAQRFAGTYTGTSGANTTITLLTWGDNSPNRMMSATGWCIVNQQSGNTTIYPLGCFVNSAQAYVCQKVETGALEFVIRPNGAVTNGGYDFWVEYTKG